MPTVYDTKGGEPGKCRGCGAAIVWVKTAKGKNMPVDADGQSHFATCPKAQDFRREKK